MAKLSKRMQLIKEELEKVTKDKKNFIVEEAYDILKKMSKVKFRESFDIEIKLGIDVKKTDQLIRGSTSMPSGTGKTKKIAVFVKDGNLEQLKSAGADYTDFEELVSNIKNEKIDFDVLITNPASMPLLAKYGKFLGPKGLMPNPKVGTVTNDLELAIKTAKKGQVIFRTDKNGYISCRIGDLSFTTEAIKENFNALITEIKKLKPASSKGIFIKNIVLSTTMGAGLAILNSEYK